MSLPFDYTLQFADIQSLENREQVAGLFAMLGYNTEARLTQTAEAMGLTGDTLKHEVKHIERIADQENGALQVYLAELRSVTVANTQALARALRSRAGTFLWVLTSDYERLDFVLFEAMAPEPKAASGLSSKGVSLWPRVLTVNRRDPGPTRLRALRRFSYTEADADYQYDKLRSAYAIAEWAEPYFNNRALFSDYYLKERLPRTAAWAERTATAQALGTFQDLYDDARQKLHGQPERTVRAQLLEPALKALGFAPRAGGRRTPDDYDQPDYALPAGAGDGAEQPVAYGNAYVWDRNLDGRDEGRDTETPNENPGAVVVSLLGREDAPDWALVTNGKTWRLYSKKAHSRASNYYEIDLEEALASPDPGEAFRYFWLLFRAEAFRPARAAEGAPGGAPDGKEKAPESFLDRLLAESALYAKALGERLKGRVFEEIFPEFAEGFIANIRANEGAQSELDEVRLDEVFQGTLAFLYRLLFLLYAEARDLLPIRETREYFDVSLTRLKQEIAEHAADIEDEAPNRLDKAYSPSETGLYQRLGALFAVIDAGDADRNVPLYNGGLFLTKPTADDSTPEARNARFLMAQSIPDRFLARGLDRLARDIDDKTQALAFIDYKSLGVRQLGSIYEGLLEFKVRVAKEKLAVVKGKKTDEVVPYRQAAADGQHIRATLRKGQVYLENDRRERKATGSYYTPDYIVKYIVKNTVGPVLAEKCEALRPKLREAQKAHRAAIKRQEAFQKQGMAGDDPEKVANTFRGVVDELFGLRVLDPAMGSGHFLVEAVDFITDGLLNFLNAFPWNPVTAELRRTRETILEAMESQKVSVDPAKLSDVNLLKRHVLKRCIYGVDVNPMAVELAKVSLWLDCFTLGAPLSFLDHHLKTGNSLIGARVEETRASIEMVQVVSRKKVAKTAQQYKVVEQIGGQFHMFGTLWAGAMLATDLMRHVGELPDMTAEQVRESRSEFRRASDALAPFKRILDIYTSRWFGNPDTKLNQRAIQFLRDEMHEAWLKNPAKAHDKMAPADQKIADAGLEAAEEYHFLHWELEFPEVFFAPAAGTRQEIGLKENGGFDAVVGNPPYVRQERLQTSKTFLKVAFETYDNGADLYTYFYELAIRNLRKGGKLGLITSGIFRKINAGIPLRQYLATHTALDEIVDLSSVQVFGDVTTYPVILLVTRSEMPAADVMIRTVKSDTDFSLASMTTSTVPPNGEPWLFQPIGLSRVLSGWPQARELRTLLDGPIYRGITTGLNEAFVISDSELDQLGPDVRVEIAVPYVGGNGIDKWNIPSSGLCLLKLPKGWTASVFGSNLTRDEAQRKLSKAYPLLYRWLSQFQDRAVDRFDQGDYWWELRACDYYDAFVLPRLHSTKISLRPTFAYSDVPLYGGNTSYILPIRDALTAKYILALLNSNMAWYYFRQVFSPKAGGYFEVQPTQLEKFPCRIFPDIDQGPVQKHDFANDGQLLAAALDRKIGGPMLLQVDTWLKIDNEMEHVRNVLIHAVDTMIEFTKNQQRGSLGFLKYLEDSLKVGDRNNSSGSLEMLSGKGSLRNYLGDYQKGEEALPFEELMDILHRNRTRLGVSLDDARFVAKLKAEYEKSLAALLPIKERLAFTDKLIDQIVYRLYGLTEDEVAVVEGRA